MFRIPLLNKRLKNKQLPKKNTQQSAKKKESQTKNKSKVSVAF